MLLSLAIFAIVFILRVEEISGDALTKEEKQDMLDRHNAYRSKVALGQEPSQPSGANIVLMDWDEKPAKTAMKWVTKCVAEHSKPEERKFGSFSWVGQNLAYWGDLSGKPAESVDDWYGTEVKGYNYKTKQCSGVCTHYTQMLWHSTKMMGCGKSRSCTGKWKTLIVCDYAPGGNFGNDIVYVQGKACSACPATYTKCHQGLCATPQQCSKPGVTCTDSVTTKEQLGTDPLENPDGIIARVVPGKAQG